MKATEIQELIDCIAKSGLDEVTIETENFKLNVKRNNWVLKSEPTLSIQPNSTVPAQIPNTNHSLSNTAAEVITPVENPQGNSPISNSTKNLIPVKSPMIGTFYRSSNPETPPFVSVGDDIKSGQIVCIIEAMKLFNEIESEVSGKVVQVLVDNASPVEYDQVLFMVEANS